MANKLFDRFPHVLESQQFSPQFLNGTFFPLVRSMRKVVEARGSKVLAGKRMISLFWEPSTRTRFSSEMAMSYLGGEVFGTENAGQFSSAKKGESLEDMIEVVSDMRPDVIVLRHPKKKSAEIAAEIVGDRVAIINAGDGPGQHPTQALTDVFTIKEEFGAVTGLKVAVVGGLKDSRVARSLCYNLARFGECMEVYLISPAGSMMEGDIKDYLIRHGVRFFEGNDLRTVAPLVDVIYQTRAQIERGTDFDLNDTTLGYFKVDTDLISMMKPHSRVMHPMPITEEISFEARKSPKVIHRKQAKNGLPVRMALLKMILAPNA